ncbi:MAG TPA: glycosyltransferase family 4 protein [Thermoleophilaceae bacterium]
MSARRALVVAPWLPEFDRESGLLRVSDMVDMLVRRNWQVTFGCLYPPRNPERYVRELEQRGVETYAPLESIESIPGASDFELAILAYWYVAERFLPELREAAPAARVLVDSVDLHFLREMREKLRLDADGTPGQIDRGQAQRMVLEINNYAAADGVLTVSEKEARMVDDLTGQPGHALSLPDAEELPLSPVPQSERRGILFLGNFLHTPNRDAVSYLCEEILPHLDPTVLGDDEIWIVGTAADQHVPELVETLPYVKTVGWVPSVLPYLHKARLSIVPLRYGAGTKRKLIQALMAGTPTVTTSVGAEGLHLRDGSEVLIADDPAEFAAAIERLLHRPRLWRRLARRGRKHVMGLHGRVTVDAQFDRVLEEALRRPARPMPVRPADDGFAREPEYAELVERVRELVESEVPRDAQVLVATRGDDGFLAFDGRLGWHFPRDADGRYAGHYPADSEAAIEHLEDLREEGATHLVLPETAFWWLDFYDGLREHLAGVYRVVHSDEHAIVYDLTTRRAVLAELHTANGNGHTEPEPAPPVTPELVQSLQPSVLPAATRYRDASEGLRVLVLGVYLADKPNTAEHVAATLARAGGVDVRQRWIALGEGPANGELRSVTAFTVTEPTPKYALLNRLLADENLADYDYVITTDDDIVLPAGFLELFLGVQARLGFQLAQPARTANSHVDLPIVIQQRGVLARLTLFVEIGPLVSFGRDIFDLVFPFDETNAMGWGFENVWSQLLSERGLAQGIVDAVPIDHSIRKPLAHYRWTDADADRARYLAQHPHLPNDACFRVLDIVGVDQ